MYGIYFKIIFLRNETGDLRFKDYMHNLEKLTVYIVNKIDKEQIDFDDEHNMCGFLTRFNDALSKPRIHLPCSKTMKGRFVYIEAKGTINRQSRLFGAVLCEVMIYS